MPSGLLPFLGSLTFAGRAWFWPLVILVVTAALILVWSYRAAPSGPLRGVCFALKTLGIGAIAFCLLEPLRTGQQVRPGANLFALAVDNSQSLQVKDPGQPRNRGETLRDWLDPGRRAWPALLSEDFEVRRYYFDARLQATKDYAELTFEGRATALSTALHNLSERYRGRPLAGVLLFTDGNATDWADRGPDAQGLPPIYPVIVGGSEPIRDLAITRVHVSQSAFEDAPVSVRADVRGTGCAGDTVTALLLDRAGKAVQKQTMRLRHQDETSTVLFRFRPESEGLSFHQVRVGLSGEREPSAAAATGLEATLANNSRVVPVERGRGPYRVLYVAGRPNWEYKFLNRAVQEDEAVQLVGLIRVAKREPKFEFRGRAGESSNPLFRGFSAQSREEVERYDQPVLIRLNTRDELELRAGFPRTPEDLYGYHAVILDDLEAEFFSADQAALLQKFVSERGGGFLMLGGMESLQQGQYERTPIGDMLPVYLQRVEVTKSPGLLKLNLSREGWLQPWARLREQEEEERARLQESPPLQVLNRLRTIKPGASLIATAKDEAGAEWPALVVQRFGHGRTAVLAVGDLWRWGLHDAAAHRDMDKAWRQLVRWLVSDVPQRVELTVAPQAADANGAVQLQVRARDPKYQPLDNATVFIEVEPVARGSATNSSGPRVRLPAEPSAESPGLYQATYVPRITGGYRATATVTNSVGGEVGRAEAGWSADLAAEEWRSLMPNVGLLEDLARRTGGEVVRADRLEEWARRLPHRQAPVMETWSYPAWHTPALFALALACLLAEWGLRRWRGLP